MFGFNYINKFQRSYVAAGVALVGVGTSVYKMVDSNNKEKRARRDLQKAKDDMPEYKIQPEFEQNRNLSAELASTGLGSAAEDFYSTLTDKGFTASTNAILSSGGSPNSLGDLIEKYNFDKQQMAVKDADLRRTGIKEYMDANSAYAGQRLIRDFGVPNERNRNDIASLNNSIWQSRAGVNAGLSDLTGSLASFVASGAASKLGDRIGGNQTQQPPANQQVVNGPMQTVMTEDQMYAQPANAPYLLAPRNYTPLDQQQNNQLMNRWG